MKKASPELSLHLAVAELLTRFAEPGVVFWHTNNTTSSARYGAKLKRMGVLAGVADFIVIVPGMSTTTSRVAFMELKAPKGRLSDSQQSFRSSVEHAGCFYEVIRSVDEATDYLRDIGALRGVRVAA